MNDDLWSSGYKPVLVGPQPFSFDEILRNVALPTGLMPPISNACTATTSR